MSHWIQVKKEYIELDGEDINIYLDNDDFGSNYAIVKKKDIEELLKDNEKEV